MDTIYLGKPNTSIVKNQQRARDLLNNLNLTMEKFWNDLYVPRRQFEYIGGNTLFKENSNFINFVK